VLNAVQFLDNLVKVIITDSVAPFSDPPFPPPISLPSLLLGHKKCLLIKQPEAEQIILLHFDFDTRVSLCVFCV
jgi:hypothetical protein